jgi:hypothetical protein
MSMFSMAMMAAALTWSAGPTAWHVDYAQAHAEALAGDKPLFIVFCRGGQTREGAIGGLTVSDAAERLLRTDYVRLVVDSDTAAGKHLAGQFEAVEATHVVILDRSGKWQVYYKSGPIKDGELASAVTQFRRAKLTAEGRPIDEVVKRPVIQLCST